MANFDNACKDLNVIDFHSERTKETGVDTLSDILNAQKEMQETTYGYDFKGMTLADLREFFHMNNHAIVDEIHELMDACGGVHDGIGSAFWKKWKKDYVKTNDMKFSDLSERDQKEAKMEIVDILHFFMNMAAAVGMDGKEMYNYYMAKNAENKARQARGY